MTRRRVLDDPAALAATARVFRRALLRPCPDIAKSGVECDLCAARRARAKREAGGVDPAGPDTNPLSPNRKGVLPDESA